MKLIIGEEGRELLYVCKHKERSFSRVKEIVLPQHTRDICVEFDEGGFGWVYVSVRCRSIKKLQWGKTTVYSA